MTNTAAFGQPLDHALIDDILTSVTRAKNQLDDALTAHEKTPGSAGVLTRSAHTALRTIAGAHTELPTDLDPEEDLTDLIYTLLADYTSALTNLRALAAAPTDPAVEYQRLLREAEEYAKRATSSPDRAEVLAKIADRWLSDALIQAHKRQSATPGAIQHFGTPAAAQEVQDIEREYQAAKANHPEWRINEHIAFEAGWNARASRSAR